MTLALVARRLQARSRSTAQLRSAIAESIPTLPDSHHVRRALEHARSECDVAVFNHCLRTYYWGAIIGQQRGRAYDTELLAIAAILHDVELGRTERRDVGHCACFACASAEHALGFLISGSMPEASAARIADAISLHLNPNVAEAAGMEAHLLAAGAALDTVGAGARAIAPEDRATVLAAHPRGDLSSVLQVAMRRELALAPRTRAGLLMRLGFGALIAGAERPVFGAAGGNDSPGALR